MHFSIIIISRQQCRDPNVLTNQCEGAWSTQGIYLTYVPTVTGITSPRIASVNEAPVITLVGHGFRSTATIETERQSKCVFVDVGLNTKVRITVLTRISNTFMATQPLSLSKSRFFLI